MSNLPPCDPRVFNDGTCIAVMADLKPAEYEEMCSDLTELGFHTDWNFMGGRAVIRTLGDPDAAQQELKTIFKAGGYDTQYVMWYEWV